MIRIAVCDDNPEHLRHTCDLVRKELPSYSIEISSFSGGYELLGTLKRGELTFDIAILDIALGEENGIELAKEMNRLLPGCRIIFLTGYSAYAPASYEAEHVWFVLKSSAEEYIGAALRKALSLSDERTEKIGITAKTGGKCFFLPLGDVLYLSRVARKTQIVCADCGYYVSGTPQGLINQKLAPFFIHCHQGYWVNLQHIAALEKNEFVLTDNRRIPISRSLREEARSRFFAALAQ